MQRRLSILAQSLSAFVLGRLGGRRFRINAAPVIMIVALLTPTLLGLQPAADAFHWLHVPGDVSLTSSLQSGQPVGATITWTASVPSATTDTANPLVYQFRVASADAPNQVVRDFSLDNHFAWTPLQEGAYRVSVAVKEGFDATDTAQAVAAYVVTSRVTEGTAVITAMPNPLVALYSAPPCERGLMAVMFRPVSSANWTFTNVLPCRSGQSRNFLVAGMRAGTDYQMQHVIFSQAGVDTSPVQTFRTGALPSTLAFPTVTVPVPPQAGSDPRTDLVIHMRAFTPQSVANPLVTDLAGNPVWYYDTVTSGLTALWPVRFLPSGTVLLFGRTGLTPYTNNDDVVREVDLAGDTLHETNLDSVNAQLTAQGQRTILGFHHEALRLPNGDTAVLGYTEACVNPSDNTVAAPPCASTDRDVVGDEIVVLNRSFQRVVWSWDAFAHLDVSRKAVLGETCGNSPNPARFCPVVNQNAEDWLHSNGLAYAPTDGNLILSIRHQDWIIKINYADGSGDGNVLWRLGKDGDFTITAADATNTASLWFSHQHNPTFLDATTLELFDNGNTRCTAASGNPIAGCNSRGQVLKLDEQNRTATLEINANLGLYSLAQGSAERLPTGTYTFGAGTLGIPPSFAQVIEVLPASSDQTLAPKVYVQQINAVEYRSYRVADLYHGTNPLCATCTSESGDTPTAQPSDTPTAQPSDTPTAQPSDTPTAQPSDTPTAQPSDTPTAQPSDTPTAQPSDTPTDYTTGADAATLGPTGIGGIQDSGDSNYMIGSKITVGPRDVIASSISAYVGPTDPNSANDQYGLAIYADNGGAPGALLASSATGMLKANAWNTLSVNATLAANTSYWLMYNANGSDASFNNLTYDSVAEPVGAYAAQAFGPWPDSFGPAAVGNWRFSIYATAK